MASPIQMTEDQFTQLINAVKQSGGSVAVAGRSGSFSNCNARFDGKRDYDQVEAFISKVNIYKTIENISDEDAIKGLPLLLTETASVWWHGVQNEVKKWNDAVKLLRAAFSPAKQPHQVYLEMFNKKQEESVPTDEFICEKRSLLAQLPEGRHTEDVQLDLIYGLLNLKIREKVERTSVKNFQELLEKARCVEAIADETQEEVPVQRNFELKKKKIRCNFCGLRGHTIDVCRKRLNKNCKRNNDSSTENKKEKTKQENDTKEKATVSCYGCGARGYYRSNCPNCKKNNAENSPPANLSFYSVNTVIKLGKNPPAIVVKIAGIMGHVQVDTAARTSIASASLLKLLQKKGLKFQPFVADITLADGTCKQQNALATKTNITLGNRILPIKLMALPEGSNNRTLLGIDFLEQAGIVLNLPQKTWSFIDEPNQWYDFTPAEIPVSDYTTTASTITSTSSQHVHYEDNDVDDYTLIPTPTNLKPRSPFLDWYQNSGSLSTENIEKSQDEPMDIKWRLIPIDLPEPPVKQVKTSDEDYSPRTISSIFKDSVPDTVVTPPRDPRNRHGLKTVRSYSTEYNSIDVTLRVDEAQSINKKQFQDFNTFLVNYKYIFENNKEVTPYIQHSIQLIKNDPIAVPPYRLSPLKREQLQKELDSMLADDIIEECESPWAAPVVLVPKKDGGTRVCIDYRQLNAVTIPDRYPLPRMDDLLQATKSTRFMSTIDLRTGYWQIDVSVEDRDKTTFITPFGTYRFKRMPFGLRNAPATFQRLMDRFRSGLNSICLLIYLDDLILCSDSFEQHLSDLKMVFERLKMFKLNANRTKCNFCCTKVKYLGHIITEKGISPNPEKVESIVNWPAPKTLKQLMSFLQTCSWYRRFIPEFAKLSQPLTMLTKKNVVWKWEEQQNVAFGKLKELLTTAPVLRQADENLPFILKTDASNYALGAVLVQGEGAEEHPIEFASRLLSSAECNYSTTEREALAIVWAVNRFRGYLEDAQTIIVTDHQPLKWLMTMKTPSGRLARWALSLQSYNLKIVYSPGKTNVVADSLSRLACTKHTNVKCELCSTEIDFPRQGAKDIREKQMADPELKDIIEALEAKQSDEKYMRWINMGYLLNKGILYKCIPDSDNEDGQLVVPVSERVEILKEYHDAPTAGHYGVDRTYQRIASRYYWTGMRQQIAKYVSHCIECQRYKAENLKPAGLLQTTASKQRFEIIAVDLFGPLPQSEDNKRWILIVEDTTSRWVELFALEEATAEVCANILLNEVFLRYGIPRRIISDNGTQFISAIMQHLTYCLGIKQTFTPVYHPESNPVERKNRDLKTQLAILVGNKHSEWPEKIPFIRFAMNTARCQSTGYSAAYLTFGRDLRTPDDIGKDIRDIIKAENFIEQITPRLLRLLDIIDESRDITHKEQIRNQKYKDKARRPDPGYAPGCKVWVKTHILSKASKGYSAKFAPKRDGPYIILAKRGISTYEVASPDAPAVPLGVYHTSALSPYEGTDVELPTPVVPIRRRGRPKKNQRVITSPLSGRFQS